jgi:uncharacterized damage-inducible protein DinB
MNPMEALFTRQYELLQGARGVLLDYCETLAPADFTRELTGFGRGSIRNLLVHTVNTYRYWLEAFARNQPVAFTEPEAVREAVEARHLFARADDAVREFIRCFRKAYDVPLTGQLRGQTVTATPTTLFTHVITHEFHHKGQILSMSRHLGYLPPDTDVLR